MLHIKLKGITNAAKWLQIFCPRTTPRLLRSKVHDSTVSEHCHVAYQIKGNHEFSKVVANILLADHSTTLEIKKVIIQLFPNIVMLYIKLKGITNAVIWHQIFCMQTPSPRSWGTKCQNSNFQNMELLHFKLKGFTKCSNMVANILHAKPPARPWGWVQ